MSEVLVEVKNLKVHFDSYAGVVNAVRGVSFSLNQGEVLAIVGESGCGKTTCGRTLIGLYKKTGGKILYHGKDMDTLTAQERRLFHKNIQMVFQDPYACLDPRMSIGTIVQEGMRTHFKYPKARREQLVAELLHRVGLPAEFASRFPHELSGGQRQRVGIARALALSPEFIVCDEPIAALDVSIQAQVINLLIRLQRELNLTYLFISHDLSMVRHISDTIAVMYLGSIVELADTDSLYDHPLHPYTRALLSAIPQVDPDSDWSAHQIPLAGEIPSPVNVPAGCKFWQRCPYAREQCKREAPPLREVAPGHCVACFFAEQAGQQGGSHGKTDQ